MNGNVLTSCVPSNISIEQELYNFDHSYKLNKTLYVYISVPIFIFPPQFYLFVKLLILFFKKNILKLQ